MKIRLEAKKHNAEIEVAHDDLNVYDVWQSLIRPALIAFGFTVETVDSLVDDETDIKETTTGWRVNYENFSNR